MLTSKPDGSSAMPSGDAAEASSPSIAPETSTGKETTRSSVAGDKKPVSPSAGSTMSSTAASPAMSPVVSPRQPVAMAAGLPPRVVHEKKKKRTPTKWELEAAELWKTRDDYVEPEQLRRRSGMDVMMSLEGSALFELRKIFEQKQEGQGKGLNQQEFVGELLRLLKPNEKEKMHLVADLIELFEQIDINGDGTMEWAEFTSYCVEAGLLATRRVKVPLRYHYVEDRRYQDTLTRSNVKSIQYIPELERLGVSDGAEPLLRLYDDDMKMVGCVDLRIGIKALMNSVSSDFQETISDPNETKARVDAFAWLPTHELLAVASSDLALTFWEADPNHPGRFRFQGRSQTNTVVRKIVWDEPSQLLFTCGGHEVNKHHQTGKSNRNGIVAGWKLSFESLPGSTREMLHSHIFVRFEGVHRDCVMDMVSIPNYKLIVTASIDPKQCLCVWNTVLGKAKFMLSGGHERGCKQLAWASDQGLLLSAGFEYEAYVWDVKTSRRPIMRLVGHRAPLMGIVVVKFNPLIRAVTADINGNFKMWSIQKSNHSTAMLLQTWEAIDEHFSPLFFGANGATREIVAGGYKLHRYCCRRKSSTSPIPRAVLYNSANMTFAVALDNEVQIYDSQTGLLVNHLHDVCDSEVTVLALDSRQRKLLVGTHKGEVLVFSYMTGALMKQFQHHSADVSDIAYCHGDKCIISVSWDRRIQICDEEPMGQGPNLVCPTLRSIDNAHATDIVCVAFDHDLSLFATASTDGIIRVYDFQFAVVEGPDMDSFNDNQIGHNSEITSLSFVGGRYPCLITADCTGIICMWAVRPSPSRGKLIHRWANLDYIWDDSPVPEDPDKTQNKNPKSVAVPEDESIVVEKVMDGEKTQAGGVPEKRKSFVTALPDATGDYEDPFEGAVPVDAIVVAFAADPKRGPMLLTADEEGYIGRWDLRPLLEMVEITPIPMSKSPTTLPSYSAHRRAHRNDDASEDLKGRTRSRSGSSFHGEIGLVNQVRNLRRRSLAERLWGSYQRKIGSSKIGALADGFPNHLQLAFAVPRVIRWLAHNSNINSMSFIDEEPYGVVTCSIDLSTRIWSLTGRALGVLTMSDIEKEKILQGRQSKTLWTFLPDVEGHLEHGTATAHGLIDAMARRKHRLEVKAKKAKQREANLLASKLALKKELDEELGSGGTSPENPLRAGLANLSPSNITQETRDQHNEMLSRVVMDRKQSRHQGDSAAATSATTSMDTSATTLQPNHDTAVTLPAIPAIPPYKHMEFEVAKVQKKEAAVMDIKVDTLPSPFLRKHLPKNWKRLTPGERLDKKIQEARDESQTMRSRMSNKTRKLAKHRLVKGNGAASAPLLSGINHAHGRSKVKSMDLLSSIFSEIDRPSPNVKHRDSEKDMNMRKRMSAKLARFDETIRSVKASERDAEEAEKVRKSRQTNKERPALYEGYEDLFKDDKNNDRAKRIREKKEEQLKNMTHFGPYTAKEVLGLRKLFNEIDEDASGQIDVDEFVNSTALQGSHLFMNAASMFGSIDRDESGAISFGELLAVSFPSATSSNIKDMLHFVKQHESQEHMKTKISLTNAEMDEITNIFKLYDVDASGGISTEELYNAMIGSNPAMKEIFSMEEMDKLVKQYDDDGNASLELSEFTKLFKDNFLEDKSAEAVEVGQRAARASSGMRGKS